MTTRRLGFYIPRANYLKVMGPVIEHLVSERTAGYQPIVLLPRWTTSKPQLRVDAEMFGRSWGARVEVCELPTVAALMDIVRAGTLDALFSVQPAISDIPPADVSRLRAESLRQGTKWVALPDGFSQNGHLVTNVPSVLANWDLVCTVGPRSIRFIENHMPGMASDAARTLRSRIAVVGYPEFDGLRCMPDDEHIRRKYGFPLNKPVVFVATAPRIVPLSVNTWIARGLDARFRGEREWSMTGVAARATAFRYPILLEYRRYLDALRRFADANGAVLVAKTRAKHRDPEYVNDCVDYLVDDQSFFPFTTLELLRTASLYFGFYSHTVSEAIVSSVYALTALYMPPRVVQRDRDWRVLSELMAWGRDGLWRVSGVSEVISGTSAAGAAALEQFARSSLNAYRLDEERRRSVLKDWFSYPCNSSAQVIDALASRWN